MTVARFAVFGFQTTHDAMRAERALLGAGLDAVLIPTPRDLGSLCGLAARLPVEQSDAARVALDDAGVPVRAWFEMDDRVGL